jgi:mono/diheme cytochrome c family protein
MRNYMPIAGIMFGLLVGIASIGIAGAVGLKDLPPLGKAGDPVAGREIYANTCIRCHGIDGKGALGVKLVPAPADLSSPAVQNRLDGSLFRRIHEGKPNTAMGAWKYLLSDDEIWDVLVFVRTLGVGQDAQP